MNITNSQGKSSIVRALEDAIIVGGASLVSALVAVGYPPTAAALYVPVLLAIGAGVVTYARLRNIILKG